MIENQFPDLSISSKKQSKEFDVKWKKSRIGYLDKKELEDWGKKFNNAYCMPAICVEPYGDAETKVKITIEEIDDRRAKKERYGK